jgi:hypothetical protein
MTVSLCLRQLTRSWRKNIPVDCSNVALFVSQAAQRKAFTSTYPPCSHIPNVLNKMRTLYHFLHRGLFIFIHLQTFLAKTGVGYAQPNDQMTSLFISFISLQKREKAPDRLGGGNPGLGG